MNEHYFSIIMAGGVGKRFWPRSRKDSPKQLLDIIGDESMINLTIKRLLKVSPLERLYIITNYHQAEMILAQNPNLSWENFIIEPSGKNTAPAIALAAAVLKKRDPEAVMGLFPADHLIQDEKDFIACLNEGVRIATEKNVLITFGIEPTRPATGYGYIQVEKEPLPDSTLVYKSKTFAEKPNLETAKRFLSSGEFLWNSGMFIWRADVILKEIEKYLPELYEIIDTLSGTMDTEMYDKTLQKLWRTIKPVSIDYGVMENARHVKVVRGKFGWSDVGSWDAVYSLEKKDKYGNVLRGDGYLLESSGNYIYSSGAQVFARNIHNLIVIADKGVILLIPRDESESIKGIVDALPVVGKEDLL
ncbi:MAG: Mannose-1-phosphate guanylyltransferase [Marinimicrobia bacterium 46_47]|nr:MAG: Mannose-1-phosphate guanylyltransferase [Marinimicrobia bacterium 46_47]KUK90525.1 MAG: Mannose-1-phosphate guanylyltransferase [Marinimicrobia bacterium 46_43]HBY18095.1 mannose-1-phosphate guanylyltransferase [Candidatus Neomarinimicrobiota bacterium]